MFCFLNPVSVVTETELTLWAISWRQWSGEWDQGAPRSPAWKQRGEPRSEDVESWIPVSSFKLILGQFRLQEASNCRLTTYGDPEVLGSAQMTGMTKTQDPEAL